MATTTAAPNLVAQLGALFLSDVKKAVLPDVQALLTNVATNGVTLAPGLPLLAKALTAVEADGLAGVQQFLKDSASLVLNWMNTATTAAPAPAPAPAQAA